MYIGSFIQIALNIFLGILPGGSDTGLFSFFVLTALVTAGDP